MNEARPSEADESSLTPAQVQRAREAIEYLSTIPFRGNVRDSGIYYDVRVYNSRYSLLVAANNARKLC